ncbi:uncharacterized protein LOC143736757 isoform X4 [Siphateles boraxobius]|uniref:uncharacterized protein LOC143736757 isoform X4 n=1 Tax=Siphateles boraxobius TaxID=180520 RepID=UPI004064A7C9
MDRKWIYVAILGMACMMLGVKGTNMTTSNPLNMTTNLNMTHTNPPNMTHTNPPNMTHTNPPNMTHTNPPNMTHTNPPNMTHTNPPNMTHTNPPNMTHTSPPNMTHTNPPNMTHTNPPNMTHTNPPNMTHTNPPNMTHTNPPNMTHTIPPNMTHTNPPNMTHTNPPNMTHTNPPNMTHTNPPNMTHTNPPNMTHTNPPNMTHTNPPNMTHTNPPNMTHTNPPNMTHTNPPNMTHTNPPNMTHTNPPNMTHTNPPNMTHTNPPNMTHTNPPNMTHTNPPNMTHTNPPNMTHTNPPNMTHTNPPNMTTNTSSGSNIVTNINNPPLEITSRDSCRRDRACFSAPPTCNPGAQGSCYFLSTRGVAGTGDNFTFELSGESDGYIAAGLSRDNSGQSGTIYACAKINGSLNFIRSTLNNQILTPDNTFIPGGFRGSINGRTIQCIFTAAGLGSSTARAATTETFISVVTGNITNGSLDPPVTKLATNASVDLSNPNSTDVSVITPSTNATASTGTATPNNTASNVTANTGTTIDKVTRDNCKKDRACFSTPASCDPSTANTCFFASTRVVNGNSDNLTFEISGESNGYIAVGLSQDNKEGDGDTIYSCANNNGTVKFIRSTLSNSILTPDNTFSPGSFRGSVNNTKIQCIFTAAGLNSNTRAANTSAFLFFFTGNFTNGTLGSPITRMRTSLPVDLTNNNSSDVEIITPSTASNTTITTTTAKPTTGGGVALQLAASQAAVVILSGILAVLLL